MCVCDYVTRQSAELTDTAWPQHWSHGTGATNGMGDFSLILIKDE